MLMTKPKGLLMVQKNFQRKCEGRKMKKKRKIKLKSKKNKANNLFLRIYFKLILFILTILYKK